MNRYYVTGFEKDRYTAGYAVQDAQRSWGEFEAVFEPQSPMAKRKAQLLAGRLNESKETEIDVRGSALDEADALIMELMGVAFPVAYPAGSTKAIALQNWKSRCVERGKSE